MLGNNYNNAVTVKLIARIKVEKVSLQCCNNAFKFKCAAGTFIIKNVYFLEKYSILPCAAKI